MAPVSEIVFGVGTTADVSRASMVAIGLQTCVICPISMHVVKVEWSNVSCFRNGIVSRKHAAIVLQWN